MPKPWDNRFLRAAQAARIPITTEIRLLVERLPSRDRTIGITGSAGKSTTTSMIAHILREEVGPSRVHIGGNIGGSLLGELPRIRADDWVVLELSSAMLHWLSPAVGYPQAEGWSPSVAVLTNITPNHIDWHGSVEHYAESKRAIASGQTDEAASRFVTAMPRTDPMLAGAAPAHAWFIEESPEALLDPHLRLGVPGRHNRANAALASCAAAAAIGRERGLSPASEPGRNALRTLARRLSNHLATFSGLPHRLSRVGEVGASHGVRCYNDSKSTTPEATLLAVAAFDDEPRVGASRVHLIAGGYDKGSDLTPIARLADRIAGLYTIGKTGPTIAAAAREGDANGRARERVFECGVLSKAVAEALERTKPGDVLLLSPGCASWDQYVNFEDRGDEFAALVAAAAAGKLLVKA